MNYVVWLVLKTMIVRIRCCFVDFIVICLICLAKTF